jgi:hypothetical protein
MSRNADTLEFLYEHFGGELQDWIDRDNGPMMGCCYPLPKPHCGLSDTWGWNTDDASKLDDLPLCIVEFDTDTYGLALTGGGMDLSWEICEAFMRLRFLPPVHFEPPAMAGKPDNEVDR